MERERRGYQTGEGRKGGGGKKRNGVLQNHTQGLAYTKAQALNCAIELLVLMCMSAAAAVCVNVFVARQLHVLKLALH